MLKKKRKKNLRAQQWGEKKILPAELTEKGVTGENFVQSSQTDTKTNSKWAMG